MIRPARTSVRETAKRPPLYKPKSFPAPIKGWVTNENLASPTPQTAIVMDNWFPELTGARLRFGSGRHGRIGSGPVESMFSYHSGLQSNFFASDLTHVFDITAPADPDIPPSPAISGQTSGYYCAVPFTTAGGQFLYILNGTDDPQLFNGTTWAAINASSSPIALTGVAASKFSQAAVYRNRLFFVEGGTMNIWYPAVGALGGALSNITMQGIFRRGGAVLFVSTWSLDSGDGIDDKFVVASTVGEVAVFEGANPSSSSAADWNLVGVYDCATPLGKNAWVRVGGDLLILTREGEVPLTAIMGKDPAALTLTAITRPIEPEWRREALRRQNLPWEMVKWPERNMGIVNVPVNSDADEPYCYVVNLQSGAWGRYTGWDTRCLHVFNEWGYFGTNDGRIMRMESGGSDDGVPYECVLVSHFDHLDAPGQHKTVQNARAVFNADSDFPALISASTDYTVTLPSPPDAASPPGADVWDVGLYDVAKWDSYASRIPVIRWNTVGRSGFAFAWQIQVSCASSLSTYAELRSIDLTFEVGGTIV